MTKTILTVAVTAAVFAAPVVAQETNLEFFWGGDVSLEVDHEKNFGSEFDTYTRLRGEIAAGLRLGEAYGALGVYEDDEIAPENEFEIDEDRILVLAGYGPVGISYGRIYGAGNIVGDQYFNFSDATSRNVGTVRVDVDLPFAHIALSREENSYADRPWEIGVATVVAGNFLRVAYEQDSEDFVAITGRQFGAWGYHLGTSMDLNSDDPYDQQFGATALYAVNDRAMVAGNLTMNNTGDWDSYGALAWYEFTDKGQFGPSMRLEAIRSNGDDTPGDNFNYEFSVRFPFGATLPASYERKAEKEEFKGFGFFDNM